MSLSLTLVACGPSTTGDASSAETDTDATDTETDTDATDTETETETDTDTDTDTDTSTETGELPPVPPHPLWSRRYANAEPGPIEGTEIVDSIVTDAEGNIYVAFRVSDSIALDGLGSFELPFGTLVAKLDPLGDPLWATPLRADNDNNTAQSVDLALLPDGSPVIVGSGAGDLLVDGMAQLNPADDPSWLLSLSPDQGQLVDFRWFPGTPADLAVDGSGRLAIIGTASGSPDFGGGPLLGGGGTDLYLLVLEADGSHGSSELVGDAADQRGQAVVFDEAGDLLVAAQNDGALDFGAGPWLADQGGASIIAKLDGFDGSELWSRGFASSEGGALGDLSLAHHEGRTVFVSTGPIAPKTVDFGPGFSALSGVYFLASLDATGTTEWVRSFEVATKLRSLALDSSVLIAAGGLRGGDDLGGDPLASYQDSYDLVLAGYDPDDGSFAWQILVGDLDGPGAAQQAQSIDLRNTELLVGGYLSGRIDWGDGVLDSLDLDSDGMVAKLAFGG